jgi:hypothetical protein
VHWGFEVMTDDGIKYQRKEIAKAQLSTAASLFLKGMDLSSVITLAGAASNILTQLVRNAGKVPFIDYARDVYTHLEKAKTPSRQSYNHHIDKLLGVSAHKHMGEKCHITVTLDLEKCAPYALTRAIADYVTLYGQDDDFVKAFLSWSWRNQRDEVMEICKSMPDKFKKMMRGDNDSKSS